MKKISNTQLDRLESKLLKSNQAREIDVELAQEYMMVDLYSGYDPNEVAAQTNLPDQSVTE